MSMLFLLYLFLKISRVVCIMWFHPWCKFCSLCVRGSREHMELLSQGPEEGECDWGWDEAWESSSGFPPSLHHGSVVIPMSRVMLLLFLGAEQVHILCLAQQWVCPPVRSILLTVLVCTNWIWLSPCHFVKDSLTVVALTAVCASHARVCSHVSHNPNVPHVGFSWFTLFSPLVSEEEQAPLG